MTATTTTSAFLSSVPSRCCPSGSGGLIHYGKFNLQTNRERIRKHWLERRKTYLSFFDETTFASSSGNYGTTTPTKMSCYNKRWSRSPFLETRKYATSTTTTLSKTTRLFSISSSTSQNDNASSLKKNNDNCVWYSRQHQQGQQQSEDKPPSHYEHQMISNMLVCGDGDLSYSASIAPILQKMGIHLTATVLESQEDHERVYKSSKSNADIITSSSPNHQVLYSLDATKLSIYFHETNDDITKEDDESMSKKIKMKKFDRIQFNFPHWLGKANNRYNRQLIDNFLKSATDFITPNTGEIHMALCDGQGGSSASTLEQWKRSWMVALYAADHGLLLTHVLPFEPTHDLSSHRGVDRPFHVGKNPKLYIFAKPNNDSDNKGEKDIVSTSSTMTTMTSSVQLQLCCRHELHIELPSHDQPVEISNDVAEAKIHSPLYTADEMANGDAILNILQDSVVPKGIRVEVPIRKFLSASTTGLESNIVVFLVVYCGEGRPLTRNEADQYRSTTETEVAKHVPLRQNRIGRMVSKPVPYSLLKGLIEERANDYLT